MFYITSSSNDQKEAIQRKIGAMFSSCPNKKTPAGVDPGRRFFGGGEESFFSSSLDAPTLIQHPCHTLH